MKALFLGHFAAGVAPRILAKVQMPLESSILDDERDTAQLAPLLARRRSSSVISGAPDFHRRNPNSFREIDKARSLGTVAILARNRKFESIPLQRRVVQTFGSSYRRAKADRLDTAHAAP